MKKEEAVKLASSGFEQLSQALGDGKSDALVQYLRVMARFHNYSFRNCLLIALQRPTASHVAGFRQWPKFGRRVKKGEKGIGILAPMVYKQKAEDQPAGGESDDSDTAALRGFKIVHVFDIEQTEGDPLPALDDKIDGDPGTWFDKLEQIVRDANIELEYVDDLDGAKGVSMVGKIALLETLSAAERFAVLSHEFAHELLHKGERRSETTKKVRETEAEAVAFVVSNAIGLTSQSRSSDYIQLYNGDTETLRESMHFIQDTAALIIDQLMNAESPSTEPSTSNAMEVQHAS